MNDPHTPTINVAVTLEQRSGMSVDRDTLIDLFAGTIGRENAASKPLRLTVTEGGEPVAVYEVKLVEDL